jgi:hypothetical protein
VLKSTRGDRLVVVEVGNAFSGTFGVPQVFEVLASSSVMSRFIATPPIPKDFMN